MEEYYKNNLATLYCGDCVEIMDLLIKNNVKVDKVITSPPYNIIRPNSTDRGYDEYKDGMDNNEYIEWTINIFEKYNKILNQNGCIIYNMSYGTENTEVMNLTIGEIIKKTDFTLADILIWKKNNATPNNVSSNKMTRICEFVYVFCKRNEFNTFTSNKKKIGEREDTKQPIYENMFNFFQSSNNDNATDLNKATFSTEFVKNIIDRYIRTSDVVLDNFSGTGTTLYACSSRNIKSIGIELSKKQCEYTKERLKKGVQLDIFAVEEVGGER
jgi:DNA (cytosine-5)-methyltransferase 1/site-specific DNA-methyltransferase (adenine-specific)